MYTILLPHLLHGARLQTPFQMTLHASVIRHLVVANPAAAYIRAEVHVEDVQTVVVKRGMGCALFIPFYPAAAHAFRARREVVSIRIMCRDLALARRYALIAAAPTAVEALGCTVAHEGTAFVTGSTHGDGV